MSTVIKKSLRWSSQRLFWLGDAPLFFPLFIFFFLSKLYVKFVFQKLPFLWPYFYKLQSSFSQIWSNVDLGTRTEYVCGETPWWSTFMPSLPSFPNLLPYSHGRVHHKASILSCCQFRKACISLGMRVIKKEAFSVFPYHKFSRPKIREKSAHPPIYPTSHIEV